MLEPATTESQKEFPFMADLHLHATKPSEDNLESGRVTDSWVNSEYRGISTEEFLDAKLRSGDYSQDCFLEIVDNFRRAGLPAVPHLVDALYHAVMDEDYPDVLTFLTIGTPSCFTMEETIRAMNAFQGSRTKTIAKNLEGSLFSTEKTTGLLSDIVPTAPVSLDFRMMARSLETLSPAAESIGYRPVVKLHPLIQQFHLGRIPDAVFDVLDEHAALLVTHTGVFQGGPCIIQEGILDIDAADPKHLRAPAGKHPKLDIVLSHMGTPDSVVERYWMKRGKRITHFRNALALLLDCPNVHGDIGGLMYRTPTEGKYGEPKSEKEVDFTARSELAFDSLALRLEDPVNYEIGGRRPSLRAKIVHGSDFPVTSTTELKKQIRVLGRESEARTLRQVKNNAAHRSCKLLRK
ncbi:amidohydrolase family protein, partial [Candidatus Micrarchaeota archaeon]|nr:amidohydrolase family protein [Candidatus Micrarchaeota archaeon]MBD3418143.1 amidohydrolase family protein [Candidatus Micrarchaeota archaeon]